MGRIGIIVLKNMPEALNITNAVGKEKCAGFEQISAVWT
jgi:hypothetical protein